MKKLLLFLLLTAPVIGQETSSQSILESDFKLNVRLASTANVADLVGTANDLEVGDTIDGVTLVAGDRVLLKNQTAAAENGIYRVTGESLAPARSTDSNSWAELPGAAVVATAGTVNATRLFINTSAATGTLGTTAISYVEISRKQRVVTTTDDATAVIDVTLTDVYELSAVANATAFSTTGTPVDGQKIIIRYKDAGVSKALTWDAIFVIVGTTLPTATTAGKWTYVTAVYNSVAVKFHVIAVTTEV